MNSLLPAPMRYCFIHKVILHLVSPTPATPRTEPRFRTAHLGGFIVSGALSFGGITV